MANKTKKSSQAHPKKKKPSARMTPVVQPEIIAPSRSKPTLKATSNKAKKKSHSAKVEVIPSVEDDLLELEPVASEGQLVPSDPVSRYMAEIRRYPLLTREQEFELAKKYRDTGDRKAAETLVTSNLRFVVKIAAEYAKFGARLIDLVQEGNIGLMHAVKEFNPYKGVKLITYAVWWIRGYIQDYLMRQYSMVRIGTTATQRKLFYQLQREKEALDRLGPEQAVAQLSGRLGVSQEEIVEMQKRLSSRDVSLDQPLNHEGTTTLSDLQSSATDVGTDDDLGLREELKILNENLDAIRPELSERELFLLESRLLADEPLTLQEVGDKYGITREAVRQLEVRLMDKIKKRVMAGLGE